MSCQNVWGTAKTVLGQLVDLKIFVRKQDGLERKTTRAKYLTQNLEKDQ